MYSATIDYTASIFETLFVYMNYFFVFKKRDIKQSELTAYYHEQKPAKTKTFSIKYKSF